MLRKDKSSTSSFFSLSPPPPSSSSSLSLTWSRRSGKRPRNVQGLSQASLQSLLTQVRLKMFTHNQTFIGNFEQCFFFCNKTFIQQTREPKALQQVKEREGGESLPLQMGEDGRGGGEVSGNVARENSCRSPKRHMVGAEVNTSVNLFSIP